MTAALETEHLSRRFGSTEAVHDLSLSVPEGSIFAFVGPNGAGKTTTIKTALNLLEPSEGVARVLGVDSRQLRAPHFQQIGYVSENQQLPEWMTVAQLIDFCGPLYPTWDPSFVDSLRRTLDLPLAQPVKSLSRGMRMKAALLISLAYRPRLLVMDEPFGGLDPLVREELTQAMIELTAQERWAVFISSHDIDEVERLADWVGFIDAGRMQLVEQTPSLLSRFRQVTVTTGEAAEPRASSASPAQILPSSPGPPHGWPSTWLGVERATRTVSFVDSAFVEDETARQVRQVVPNVVVVEAAPISLKQIFVALARSWRSTRSA